MATLMAFLHHLAAFGLVAMLVLEFILIKDALTVKTARTLQRADLVFGIAAGVVLAAGLLRVFYFEKGADYYFHSIPFMIKLALFLVVGLLSAYPTVEFLSWSKLLKQGQLPSISARKMRTIRLIIHLELGGIVVLILCAALMAKGLGYHA